MKTKSYTWILDTSSPIARMGLMKGSDLVDVLEWEAGRELSKTFFSNLEKLFANNKVSLTDIGKIVAVRGPGTFTGLRIGISIVNAFAFALDTPISGIIQEKSMSLEEIYLAGRDDSDREGILTPFYDREPNITKKKRVL